MIDKIIGVALKLMNPKHLKNWFTHCCYWGASHFCKYMKKGYNEKASKTVKKDEIKK
ncbi:hypothetical protein [Microcoleus sp. herbarium2]|uniref:hypothetical protein n=1 Tax=Microcoleus sp. herbarium2 TaxID=3055433 RepID=UPI002FCFCF12